MGRTLLAAAVVSLLVASGAGGRALLTVSISGAPPNPSSSPDATFTFSADLRDVAFTCSLDGSRATECRSPVTYRGLSLGGHTFVVTGRGGGEVASARFAWTIAEPPSSPPPTPAPPSQGWLTVVVEGGGTVAAPGITCPADCSEAFQLGSTVGLTASPTAGYELVGWSGACTGQGACAATIGEATFVKASFVPVARPATAQSADLDRDGVQDLRDRCPETARRLRLVMRGCSLPDLLQNAESLTDVYDFPGEYAQRFDGIDELKPVYRGLLNGLAMLGKGARQVESGDVCGGADTARRGNRAMQQALAGSKKLVADLQAAIMKEPSSAADTDVKDLKHAGLRYRQGLVEDAADEAAAVQRAFDAACGSLGKARVFTGVVQKIDAAKGLLQLGGGGTYAYGGGRGPGKVKPNDFGLGLGLAEGARARIVAQPSKFGPAVIKKAVGLAILMQKVPALNPCVSLLIAPAQNFAKPNPILHAPRGYLAANLLWLEEGMRFGATPECDAGKNARYSLRVEFAAPGKSAVIPDLTAEDGPVSVLLVGGSGTWTITVTLRRQGHNCEPTDQAPPNNVLRRVAGRLPLSAAKSFPCPVVPIGTTTYHARVLTAGAYATAHYERTILSVNENGLDATRVTGFGAHVHAVNASFAAEGYGTVGADPPFSFKTIHVNQPFGVRPDNWYGNPNNPSSWLLRNIGVDHFAGLVWPHIVGTRGGKPYRYRARLPKLVKDLLPACPGVNCFYRLPWKAGDIEQVTQGNSQPFSHFGNQQFAFDFVHEDGETIYATRGGVVGDVQESLTMNCVPPADCLSNYVRIDHQDGSYSYYAHVQTNSVFPSKGAKVARGQALALVGNVGRSTDPHLHYQVSLDNANTYYGQSIQICFEAAYLVGPGVIPCVVPPHGYAVRSTNG